MSHAYVVRVPLPQAGAVAPVAPQRLSRLSARGWTTTEIAPGVDAAVAGAAEIARSGDWIAVGMAFLPDRAAVRAALGQNTPAPDASDMALLLAFRLAHGDALAAQVAGSFSVAFLDTVTGAFEAHRDGFGLYPLCYTVSEGALTLGSDMRACLHLSGRPLAIDRQRVADFIHGDDIDLDRTAFAGLSRLPPGHRLGTTAQGVTAEPVWTLEAPEPMGAEGAAAALRKTLETATRACMASGGTVGAMLSGGLDSSSLVTLAAERGSKPLRTLSFVYAGKAYDESAYIEAANRAAEAEPHLMNVDTAPDLAEMGPLVEEQMDLFLAPGLQKSCRIYREARALGLDGLIDGHGGDEVISHGYGRLAELAARRRFVTLLREARGAAQIHGVPLTSIYAGHIAQYAGLPPRNLFRRVLMKLARRSNRKAAHGGWTQKPASLIATDLRGSFDAETRYRPVPDLQTRDDFLEAERVMHLKALTSPLMVQSFEVLHRSATAAGVLPRYPFFDRRVVSLCLALPSELKLRDGRSRWILREAMAGVLPDKIRLRPDKAEFGAEFRESLISFFAHRTEAEFAPLSPFVDTAAAERLRQDIVSGKVRDVLAARSLWRLAVLLHWVRAFGGWQDAQAQGTLI